METASPQSYSSILRRFSRRGVSEINLSPCCFLTQGVLGSSPPFLVSRYLKNGNITHYLMAIKPNANRVKLVRILASLLAVLLSRE